MCFFRQLQIKWKTKEQIYEELHLTSNKGLFLNLSHFFQSYKTHLNKLPVVFQLFLEGLDLLVEVFGVGLVVLLRLQALCFLLIQLSFQGSEAPGQGAVVLLRLPLQVQLILGQTLRLCQ